MFLVKRGALEDGFDPNKYFAMQNENYKKIHSSKYEVSRLAKLSDLVTKGETPLWRGFSYQSAGIPFLKGKDIKEGKLNFDNIAYIEEHVHNGMKRSILNDNFLLLTMAGTLGDVAFFKKEYPESNINQDIAKIRLDTSKISYEYAVIFFETNLAKSQIAILSNGGTRGHLNFDKIKSFKIVIPPLKTQAQIVEKYNQAYELKSQKEAEAKALLESIDGYLLEKLGIELPTANEPKKVFYTRFKEVQGKRLDSYYHKIEFEEIDKKVKIGKFPLTKLRDISLNIINGYDSRDFVSEGLTYLRVGNVKKMFFDLEDVKYIQPFSPITKDIQLQIGDLLITRKGSFGNAAVADKSVEASVISSEVFKIPLKQNCNAHFLAFWLNSFVGQTIFDQIKTGGIMGHLTQDVIGAIKIPLPPLNIQNEIAEHIADVRQRAKTLEDEAKEAIETAKAEVERLILGES